MKKNKSYDLAKRVTALFIFCLMVTCVLTACSQTATSPSPEQTEQREVIAKYNDIELNSTADTATLVSDNTKIVLDGGSGATAIIYQFTGLAVTTTPTGTGAVNVNITATPATTTVYELKAKALYGFETSQEKTYYIKVERANKLLSATYNNVELSQDSEKATKIAVGSKIVLDGGSGATAITYQFTGLAEKTTQTPTGAVNVNVHVDSAIGVVHTLRVKAIYESEESEEKTYYVIIEE